MGGFFLKWILLGIEPTGGNQSSSHYICCLELNKGRLKTLNRFQTTFLLYGNWAKCRLGCKPNLRFANIVHNPFF